MLRIILSIAALAIAASTAASADVIISGTSPMDDTVAFFLYSVQSTADVTVQTTSYATGGFEPILTLFDDAGNELFFDSGYATAGDASFSWNSLAGVTYTVALTEYDNFANGPTLGDGFAEQGNGDFTAQPPFNPSDPGGAFQLPGPIQLDGDWTVAFSSSEPTLSALETPEPPAFPLALCAALIGLPLLRKRLRVVLALPLLAAPAVFAQGPTVFADAYVQGGTNAGQNFGAQSNILVGPGSPAVTPNSGYIQFNLAGLNGVSSSNIQKAVLWLWVNRVTTAGSIDVYDATNTWQEGSINWNNAPVPGSSLGNVPITAPNQWVGLDITSEVQGWMNTPALNNGIVLEATTAPTTAVSLDAKENTATSHPAQLQITFITTTTFSGSFQGDVTGTPSATVVSSVGGQTASAVAAGAALANNATNNGTGSTIVKRDSSGDFSAHIITATLNGSATNAQTAVNFSGSLTGDVGGTQGATVIQSNAVTAAKIASGQVVKSVNGFHDSVTIAAGSGLSVSNSSGTATLAASYGGDGSATTLSRSDHDHAGQSWTTSSGVTLRATCNGTPCIGFEAFTNDTNPDSAGVYGQAGGGSSQAVGVWGATYSTDNQSAAVFGQALAGSSVGVWGASQSQGLAGFFEGNVQVTGSLSKSGGSFKIDHPLDPANQYLYHSFVESPDMMNIYNGNITTDAGGFATVALPSYFEALNGDYRYQLTVVGQFAQAIVSQKIRNNQFVIQTDKPNVEVSWQVTGVRHDAWANAHRIPNEVAKPESERGTYIHPELFGKPATMTVRSRSVQVSPDRVNK